MRKYLLLILGVFLGNILLTLIDVEISVSKIDLNNPDTWPNMHPGIRYYFIPIIGGVISIFAIVIELVKNHLFRIDLTYLGWFLGGIFYSAITLPYLLRHFVSSQELISIIGLAVILCDD